MALDLFPSGCNWGFSVALYSPLGNAMKFLFSFSKSASAKPSTITGMSGSVDFAYLFGIELPILPPLSSSDGNMGV